MCGIFGIFGNSAKNQLKKFDSLSKILSHRGPDGFGTWKSKKRNCLLMHNRLAVIDLTSGANQPMVSPKGVISFNGEIYNHLELRKKKKFHTHCDTETLLHLLDTNNLFSLLPKLKGMYAVAYFNKKKNNLILFRDTLGIKPLYYMILKDKTIIFSSEIKALIPFVSEKINCNLKVLKSYFNFENWPQGQSMFDKIYALKPGEILTCNRNEIVSKQIKLSYNNANSKNNVDYYSKVRKVVENSVNFHLMSDVPIATYLSGGIDSSLITLLAAQKKRNIISYNGYFDCKDPWYDESKYAEIVAEKAKVELIKVKITPNDFIESFDKLIYHLDEPRMGMGTFSQFIVAKEVKKRRKVILSGHGGDELFAGYPLFKFYYFFQNIFSLSSIKILFHLNRNEMTWFFYSLFKLFTKRKLYFSPKIANDFSNCFNIRDFEEKFTSTNLKNCINQLYQYYLNLYIPSLLTVEDKISMAHSIETRTPLWSQDVVNEVLKIPIEQKLKNGDLKWLLKNSFSEILGERIINGPKRGFPTPLRLWFRNELKDEVEKRLLNSSSNIYKFVSKDKIKSLITSHNNGNKSLFAIDEKRAHMIWMLLSLESWIRQFKIKNSKNVY